MELRRVLCLVLAIFSVRAAYIFPPVYLQAKVSGGIKAYLQDSCGVDGFSFQIKRTNETAWKTGNGTKEENFWTFWDRGRPAKIGDVFDFSARVWYKGVPYTYPAAKWTVPELIDEYEDPPFTETDENCMSTTELPKKGEAREKEVSREPKEIKGEGKEEVTGRKPIGLCEWTDPPKTDPSKEEVLERQLAMLQCEMSAFLERTSKLTAELNKELLDLKKLNYAAVARMQRLESLIRTIPKTIPYPYV